MNDVRDFISSDLEIRLVGANKKFQPLNAHNSNIISNGENNNTPYWVKYFTEESPTASSALAEFVRYTAGKSEIQESELHRIYDNSIFSYCQQGGFYLSIKYKYDGSDENGKPLFSVSLEHCEILPYENMRLSKDLENEQSFFYEADWIGAESAMFNDVDKKSYYPYNADNDVILSQMKRDYSEVQKKLKEEKRTEFTISKGLKHYKGQVYFFNPSNMEYPLSFFYASIGAMRTEVNADIYEGATIQGGFMDKKLFLLTSQDATLGKNIRQNIETLVSDPNVPAVVIQSQNLEVNLKDYIHEFEIKSQYDDKLLSNALARAEKNIIRSANNIPTVLINPDAGMFGNSGEAFKVAEQIYSRKCEPLRLQVIKALEMVTGYTINVKNLVENDED